MTFPYTEYSYYGKNELPNRINFEEDIECTSEGIKFRINRVKNIIK